MTDEVLESPIFKWNVPEIPKDLENKAELNNNLKFVLRALLDEPKILPFPSFRIHWGDTMKNVFANLEDSDGLDRAWVEYHDGFLSIRFPLLNWFDEEALAYCETDLERLYFKLYNDRMVCLAPATGEPFWAPYFNQIVLGGILWFVWELLSVENFVARVRPDKPGKSVEWLKSREHYILIDAASPANNPEFNYGDALVDATASVKRQAHVRRAHWRRLSHPRFKENVGKLIRVNKAWVGPPEFKCFGSIYKIINRQKK